MLIGCKKIMLTPNSVIEYDLKIHFFTVLLVIILELQQHFHNARQVAENAVVQLICHAYLVSYEEKILRKVQFSS